MITQDELNRMSNRKNISWNMAESILEGGENYDGADGAREISSLCEEMSKLISEIRRLNNWE